MKTLLILALDGVVDSSLAITLDVFRAGRTFLASADRAADVRIVVAGYRNVVRTSGNLRLTVDLTFNAVRQVNWTPAWIVVPGLGLLTQEAIAARLAKKDALEAMRLLQHMERGVSQIGASCSAVFLLAQAGLLDGRHATMTWWLASIFRARHPQVRLDETRMLVRDGRFLTAGSAFSQLDLSLAIVADAMGTAVAHLCSRYLLIDSRASQARYMMPSHIQHIDPTVVAAERWIDSHLSSSISVVALSSHLAVSPKTLSRRIGAATGVSPIKFIQRRRLLHAAHLIETTSMSIDVIAAKVGYQDATALRKLVKREFGTTPAALR
jgi:transcriptional regulator GlxA family with amidase domain